jgi:hypothetical protein
MWLKRLWWRVRIVCLAARWVGRNTLGDEVWFQGRRWRLVDGAFSPWWDLARAGEKTRTVHELRFRKVRSVGNALGTFVRMYRFYRDNWLDIWVSGGIEPWMRACPIWPDADAGAPGALVEWVRRNVRTQ